ncbi:hypothetical protein Poli38472_008310 [Pythium oligandrum]|uniref:Uncharacterized protein n=1 Tax=Pythium oligandrum TaxID=41045 RepID=A0A8K1FPI6_PYTOL|nr:hypothetical protein Poli38472_008310 [Pythium oligandrum]|eukprot:TMW65668.1 hypothetical protein Poli38472_008310 [Pythium oligandrum]
MVKFFQCYQRNGCITSEASSTEDPLAAFIVISDAFQNVGVSTSSWDVFQVRPPQFTFTSGTPRPIDVDRGSNYQQFVHSLGAMLAESAQDVRIRAVELPADPSQYYIPLEVTYYNFVGIAPTIYGSRADGNGLRGGDIMLRTLTGAQSSTSVLAMMLRTYSTTRVLSGLCAACGAALFGCDQSAIASGSCTFLQPGASSFTACLRQSSDLNFFLTQVAQRDVRKPLATQSCYDTSSSGATFKEDQWYKTSEALACFETAGCPFGPLHESIWDDNMVRISSNTITQNAYIPVNTFEASFRAMYVSRQLDSDPFDASATSEDLEALLMMVLPESAEVFASISPSGEGYTITVTYHLVFVPSLQLSVVVSDPSVNVQNSSPSTGLVVELSTVTTDPTTFAVI